MRRILNNFGKVFEASRVFANLSQHQQSMPYYAVAAGWEVGVFDTWKQCETKVKAYSKPIFKKFNTKEEAEAFLKKHNVNVETSSRSSYDPRNDAVPLARTPIKKKNQIISSDSESEDDVSRPAPVPKDSWPDDVQWEEDDDDILLAAVAEVEGIPENSLKRKNPPGGSGVSDTSAKVMKKYSHESIIWEPIGLKKIGDFEFPIDSEGFVIVYTDGSCINNGRANAVAGFGVYFSENHALNVAQPVSGRVTNNAGEIQAAIYAVRVAKDFGIKKLCLSTDSQFLINAVTAWIKGWKRKGWKLKGGQEVKNKDDFIILDDLLDGSIEIKWNYVKGHKGIIGNEKADYLARQGAALYKTMKGKN